MGEKGLEAFFMQVTFKYFLKKGAYSKDEFMGLISQTVFKNYDVKEKDVSLYVYLRKWKKCHKNVNSFYWIL